MIQPLPVLAGNAAATFVFAVQMPEFEVESGCLKFVKAAIVTLVGKDVFAAGTVIGQAPNGCCQLVIVRRDRSPIAQRTQGLGWVKTVTGGMAQRAGFLTGMASFYDTDGSLSLVCEQT